MENYNFSVEKNSGSILVARLMEGKKSQLVYLTKDATPLPSEKEVCESLYNYVNDNRLRISSRQMNDLEQGIISNILPENPTLRKIFTSFKADFNKKNSDVYLKGDQKIECMPLNYTEGKRDCVYVCGCSGSGKSTWISGYARNFSQMFKGSPIFFISAKSLKDEDAYEGIKIKQLDLSLDQLEEITSEGKAFEFFKGKTNSLVIFDDAEALSKEQQVYVDKILESILQIGRSKHIYCIVSRHVLNNGVKTKVIFNECNKFVVFPNGISRYQLNYTLKNYLGFDKFQIEKTLHTKSRWILINNHIPRYILGEQSLVLL